MRTAGSVDRQRDVQLGSTTGRRAETDPAAMCRDDAFGDRQPKPVPLSFVVQNGSNALVMYSGWQIRDHCH